MRSYAVSPLASFVIHSRWPCTVTPRGTTMLKSASQVVFVDGTITPIRLRTLMMPLLRVFPSRLCHNLRDPGNDGHRDPRHAAPPPRPARRPESEGRMKLDVKTLTTGLQFHGEVEGKRQRYFVLSSARQYFVMSLSRSKRDAGNFNLVGKAVVEKLYRRLRGRRGLTARLVFERSQRGVASAPVALHKLLMPVATGPDSIDQRRLPPPGDFFYRQA